MTETTVPLKVMLDEVEREIVTRKRALGARADSTDTVAGRMLANMKAVAANLRQQLELEETGESFCILKWAQIDPGRPMPDYIQAPALLSYFEKAQAGGYRLAVFHMLQDSDRHRVWNVYAWAPVPAPARVGTPAGLLVPAEPQAPNEEKTDAVS